MNYAYGTSRAIPAYNEDGSYSYYQKNYTRLAGSNYNILNEMENSFTKQKGNGLNFQTNLRFNVTNWLNLNALVSYSTSNTHI